jgi:insertion element IS1 protein InsB
MITTIHIHTCRKCQSENIVKNGHNGSGNQQYLCKACGARGVLEPSVRYTKEYKETVLKSYTERSSLRGLERTTGHSRKTLTGWMKAKLEALPEIKDTLQPSDSQDVLELDEVWSYVKRKSDKAWLWTAICKRTRQIVAFAVGDRSEETCKKLYNFIPENYRHAHTFSDFWKAYAAVFPAEKHTSVGKETGLTNHMERWNNTLRQHVGRLVRKTLSFSKDWWWHEKVIYWFIILYNTSLTP